MSLFFALLMTFPALSIDNPFPLNPPKVGSLEIVDALRNTVIGDPLHALQLHQQPLLNQQTATY